MYQRLGVSKAQVLSAVFATSANVVSSKTESMYLKLRTPCNIPVRYSCAVFSSIISSPSSNISVILAKLLTISSPCPTSNNFSALAGKPK